MEDLKNIIKKLLETGGFNDFSIDADAGNKHVSVFIHDVDVSKFLPKLIFDFEHLVKLISKKNSAPDNSGDPQAVAGTVVGKGEVFILDINNYRRERERLISELAKAAARKVLLNREQVELPAMNGYERRLVHLELASRPDVKTESIGEGSERRVVIKLIL